MTTMTLDFDGSTFSRIRDGVRLSTQLVKVFDLMSDGGWRTLREIQDVVGGTETGVSARIRDLRKEKFGGYAVESRRRAGHGGTWEYRLVVGG